MTKNIKLIAFDLDLTLLRTGGVMSDFTAETLREAASSGIYTVPVTGRTLLEMEDILPRLSVRYAVTVNGAVIRDLSTKTTLYRALPDPDVTLEKIAKAQEMGLYIELHCGDSIYTDRHSYDNMEELGVIPDYLELARATRKPLSDLYGEMKRARQVEKLVIFFKSREERERLQGFFTDSNALSHTSAFVNELEFTAKNVNKGNGLSMLAELLKIDRENVMALGDGMNDVPMLKWAGMGVAMENAVAEAKLAADAITSDNDSDGAAWAVRKWAL